MSDGVIVELIAVAKELRGQGYGAKLFKYVNDLAEQKQKDCLATFIRSFFPAFLTMAAKGGYVVTDCIHFSDPVKLPLLYLEKRSEYLKLKDYF